MHSFQVLFNDRSASVLGCQLGGNEAWQLSTRFSRLLNPKEILAVHAKQIESNFGCVPPIPSFRAALIDVVKSESLTTAGRKSASPALEEGAVGVSQTISGTIVSKVMHQHFYVFELQNGGKLVKVFVAGTSSRRTQNIMQGDYAEFTGVLLQRKNVVDWNGRIARGARTRPVMYVASAADVLLKKQTVLVNGDLLGAIVGFTAFVLLAGFVWVRSLRHQVSLRTESLNAVTSHLATSFEAARGAILLNDQNNRVSRVNDRFAYVFGFLPEEGTCVQKCLQDASLRFDDSHEFDAYYQSILEGNTCRSVELDLQHRRIQIYASPILNSTNCPLGNLWSFEDVTERRDLERKLLQSQKMEAVGQLSGGIAHDFNNLLTVISNNVSLIVYQAERQSGEVESFADPIHAAIDQAAELTNQLLDFSRRSQLDSRCVDANSLVERVHNLARRTLDSTIQLRLEQAHGALPIYVDVTRIEQVLLNLCINARDAIVDGHGSICLRTSVVDHAHIGEAICVEVQDDGHGMLAETKRKIFEPFFTTKERGQGTGLGLSTAFGVVQQHGGEIDCITEWAQGTTFRVYFPRSELSLQVSPEPNGRLLALTRPLKLLLVDDEEKVRVSGERVLRTLGHVVEVACNGIEAIETLARNCDFDAILLDLTMPEMTGSEAYEIIRDRWPELPVAICSGYSSERIIQPPDDEATLAFLPKPFQVQDLQKTLATLTN